MSELMTTDVDTSYQPETTTTTGGFNFNEALSTEYRDNPSITKFGGDVNKLSKSYLELQSLMGQSKVAVPKDDMDLTAWSMYDKAFGIPDDASGYELTSDIEFDMTEFKDLMKKHHIPPKTAQELLNAHLSEFAAFEQQQAEAFEAEKQATLQSLKQEWGQAFEQKRNDAALFLRKMAGNDEDYNHFLSKIGNDAKFIKILAKMGEATSEGSIGGMTGQVASYRVKTPSEARAEFERIQADSSDAYWAGIKNKRNDMAWCKANGQSYVSEAERKERVNYVDSIIKLMG